MIPLLLARAEVVTVCLLTAPGGGPGCLPGSQPFAGPRTERLLNSTRLLKAYTKGPGTFFKVPGLFFIAANHNQPVIFLEDGPP